MYGDISVKLYGIVWELVIDCIHPIALCDEI